MAIQLPYSYSKRYGIMAMPDEGDGTATLCYKPGLHANIFAEIHRYFNTELRFKAVDDAEFERSLNALYEQQSSDGFAADSQIVLEDSGLDLNQASSQLEIEDALEQHNDAPAIRLINTMLMDAVKRRASDIHIQMTDNALEVRFRIDGILHNVATIHKAFAPKIISRIKVMASLDIAEKRVPQDGRISFRFGSKLVDIRVSILPANGSERAVLRLLDKSAGLIAMDQIGIEARDLTMLRDVIQAPHGIILVVGPTGSGKTTTLYAMLNELNHSSRNIMTIEDPVEYHLDHISQTSVNNKTGMSFANGLRAILRQDPDIVMVGEIRDKETANIAIQASQTGHLVLSTLHTNSAASAITRLRDIGIEHYLLSSSLLCVVAQRLVRRLCDDCKVPSPANAKECLFLGEEAHNAPMIYHAPGCEACNHLGYSGRLGLYEILSVTDQVREMIHQQQNDDVIANHNRRTHQSLMQDGIQKIYAGLTSCEEVLRVAGEGHADIPL